jgi:ABC-type transporter Mla MlaB component
MHEVPLEVTAPAWLTVTPLEGRTGLRLAGEADLCTAPALRRAIEELPAGAREIHLQLAGLELIDVAAARLLVTLTERPGRPAVILHYPPPCLIRVIRLAFHDAGSPCRAAWRPVVTSLEPAEGCRLIPEPRVATEASRSTPVPKYPGPCADGAP